MSRYRVLIADDEQPARRGLRALLARDPEVVVVGECDNGSATVEALSSLEPDVLFLDIQMPDMNGFDVLAAVNPESLPTAVFVTAHDESPLRAFEVHALDYLLKPFSDARFFQALERAKEQARSREARAFRDRILRLVAQQREDDAAVPVVAVPPASQHLTRLAVGNRDEVRFVDVARVRWIEADTYNVRVHCDGASFRLRGNIGSFAGQLDPGRFVRIHRSVIVNLDRVASLRTLFHGQVVVALQDGTELKVSRAGRAKLLELLQHRS
jgi:two-component system, LytTR family, response regulator